MEAYLINQTHNKEQYMSDMEQLIIMGKTLCDHLDHMAENERKYGAEMCHLIEQISYSFYKSTCELKEINEYCLGGVA